MYLVIRSKSHEPMASETPYLSWVTKGTDGNWQGGLIHEYNTEIPPMWITWKKLSTVQLKNEVKEIKWYHSEWGTQSSAVKHTVVKDKASSLQHSDSLHTVNTVLCSTPSCWFVPQWTSNCLMFCTTASSSLIHLQLLALTTMCRTHHATGWLIFRYAAVEYSKML